MRKPLLIVAVVLLVSVVGYMALDRTEKNAANAKNQAFDRKFSR